MTRYDAQSTHNDVSVSHCYAHLTFTARPLTFSFAQPRESSSGSSGSASMNVNARNTRVMFASMNVTVRNGFQRFSCQQFWAVQNFQRQMKRACVAVRKSVKRNVIERQRTKWVISLTFIDAMPLFAQVGLGLY